MTYSPQSLGIVTLGLSQASKFLSADSSGDLIMPDSDKIEFGASSDMVLYHDATDSYITNKTGALKIATETSAIAISIGHSVSEVTVNDNLTVTGDFTVNGTTTSVNQVYIDVTNAFVFEGASSNAHETTLGIVEPTADATINLPAMAAGTYYLPVLAAASTTSITSTPAELNILDGVTATATELNYLDITTLGTAAASKAMTWAADSTWTAAGGTCADLGIVTTGIFSALTVSSSSASLPILHITNTHAGATSGELRFNKDSASGDDSDVMGLISFYGTDAGEATHERLAYVDAIITDSAAGSEAASLRFYVAENDANLTAGLVIAGQADSDGEVDVTIGAGAASTTTVAGTLTMGSTAALTNAGLVAVANQSGITGLGTIGTGVWQGTAIASAYIADDAITGAKIALFDDSLAATTTHFLIADGTDYSSFALSGDVTCTNAGVVSIAANSVDGTHIALGSDAQGDIMYYDGTNWARLGYGTSGHFLKTQGTGANPAWAAATVSGLACDDLSVGDAAVTISTSSGNITIETQSSDTDIIFNVDDGGSQITALTLDGSDDGAAIFKSTIKGTVFKPAVEVVSSANVTISNGYTAISTAGSNRTATLPEATAALVGATYTVKKTDSGSGNVSVTAEGDGAIDTGTSVVLYHQFESVTVICRAADVWDIM
jgi:hypothetical protein